MLARRRRAPRAARRAARRSGQASASARASANSTGRRTSETSHAATAHDIAAGVDDQRLRRQQRLDLVEQQRTLFAACDQPRRGRCRARERPVSTSAISAGMRAPRAASSARASASRAAFVLQAPHGDAGDQQLVDGLRSGRQGCRIDLRQRLLGLVELADQQQPPDREIGGAWAAFAGRHALRARCTRRPAPWLASRGRARRGRSRPRRRRSGRAPRPPSGRRRAPPAAAAALARPRSPSCAMAMPRSASAGASSRSATWFSAPRGSPAASARAAARSASPSKSRHTCHSQTYADPQS